MVQYPGPNCQEKATNICAKVGYVILFLTYRITRIIYAANVQKIQFGGTYNPGQVSVFNTVGIRKVSASPFFTLLYRTVWFSTRCDILLGARPGF